MPRTVIQWEWEDAFSKFGFGDGDGMNHTQTIADFIETLGYEVYCDSWGIHNYMIFDIREKIAGTDGSVSILFNIGNEVGDNLDDWNDECIERMRSRAGVQKGERFIPEVFGYAKPQGYLPEDLIDTLNKEFHAEYEIDETW